jgi:hypothetical protein
LNYLLARNAFLRSCGDPLFDDPPDCCVTPTGDPPPVAPVLIPPGILFILTGASLLWYAARRT